MTPPKGVRLAGYPHFTRENTGYHDRLYATAVYLTDGETEFVFVTLDILFFSKKYAAEVRQRVSAQCGIPERQILICCSHTHSGPWAAGNPELEATAGNSRDIDPDYLDSLIEGVTGAIVGASGDTFEAPYRLRLGSYRCRVGDRRKPPRQKRDLRPGTERCGGEGHDRRSPRDHCELCTSSHVPA